MNNTEVDVLPHWSVNLLIVASHSCRWTNDLWGESNLHKNTALFPADLFGLIIHCPVQVHKPSIEDFGGLKWEEPTSTSTNRHGKYMLSWWFEATSKPGLPSARYKPHSVIATSYEKMVEVGLQTPSWVAWWCALESGTFASGLRDMAGMPGWVYLTFMMNAFINPYAWSPRGIHFWRAYGWCWLRWRVGTETYHSRWFVQPCLCSCTSSFFQTLGWNKAISLGNPSNSLGQTPVGHAGLKGGSNGFPGHGGLGTAKATTRKSACTPWGKQNPVALALGSWLIKPTQVIDI